MTERVRGRAGPGARDGAGRAGLFARAQQAQDVAQHRRALGPARARNAARRRPQRQPRAPHAMGKARAPLRKIQQRQRCASGECGLFKRRARKPRQPVGQAQGMGMGMGMGGQIRRRGDCHGNLHSPWRRFLPE